jgi:hypothetical protein
MNDARGRDAVANTDEATMQIDDLIDSKASKAGQFAIPYAKHHLEIAVHGPA